MSAPLIYKKMSEVMRDIKYIAKDQKNQAQGFKFRGIDNFVNTLYPALVKHGVFMTPRCAYASEVLKDVVRGSGKPGVDKHVSIRMEYDFYAEDGSKVTVGPIPAEGLDSGDKATNKALSAALKYALIQTFSVPTEDMAEADLESPEIGVSPSKSDIASPSAAADVTSLKERLAVETKIVKRPASFKRATPAVAEIPKPVEVSTADGWEYCLIKKN
jgi:hypothetical protein